MRIVKPWGLLAARRFAALSAVLLLAAPAAGYVPPVDDLIARLAAQAPLATSAILEYSCHVYPVTLGQGLGEAVSTQQDKGRSFRQRVYWQRRALLAVETLAEDGTVLHVSIAENGTVQQAALSTSRRFSDFDLHLVFHPFLEGDSSAWKSELTFWGVTPRQTQLVLLKGAPHFRAQESPEKALWVERESLRPVQLVSAVGGGPEPLTLSIAFSDYIALVARARDRDEETFPRKATFRINGQRFKEVALGEFEVNPPARKFPLQRLRQQAAGRPPGRER